MSIGKYIFKIYRKHMTESIFFRLKCISHDIYVEKRLYPKIYMRIHLFHQSRKKYYTVYLYRIKYKPILSLK